MNNNFKCDKELKNYKNLCFVMNNAVDYMFNAIDKNNVSNFTLWFTMWVNAKRDITENKYNDCNHKLCDEIMQFANKNNVNVGW